MSLWNFQKFKQTNSPTSRIRHWRLSYGPTGSISHHKGRPVKKVRSQCPNLHLFCYGPVQAPMWFCSFQALLVMTLVGWWSHGCSVGTDDLNGHRWDGKLHKFSHLVCPGGSHPSTWAWFWLLAQVWPVASLKKEAKKTRWPTLSSYFWRCLHSLAREESPLPINQENQSHPRYQPIPSVISTKNGSQRSRLKGCSAWDSWGKKTEDFRGWHGIHDHMIPNTRLFTWNFSEGQLDKHFLTFCWR